MHIKLTVCDILEFEDGTFYTALYTGYYYIDKKIKSYNGRKFLPNG